MQSIWPSAGRWVTPDPGKRSSESDFDSDESSMRWRLRRRLTSLSRGYRQERLWSRPCPRQNEQVANPRRRTVFASHGNESITGGSSSIEERMLATSASASAQGIKLPPTQKENYGRRASYLPLRARRRPSSVNAALRSSGLRLSSWRTDPSAFNSPRYRCGGFIYSLQCHHCIGSTARGVV